MPTPLPIQSRRILIPLDGSIFAEAALPVRLSLAHALSVGVLLLYCVAPVAVATSPAGRPSGPRVDAGLGGEPQRHQPAGN